MVQRQPRVRLGKPDLRCSALDQNSPPAQNWAMIHRDFDTDTLASYLHISPTQVQKLAERGNVPGQKIAGQWRFSKGEIHHWLEERIGAAGQADLEHVQGILDRAAAQHETTTVAISELLLPEAIAIPLPARTRNSVIKA